MLIVLSKTNKIPKTTQNGNKIGQAGFRKFILGLTARFILSSMLKNKFNSHDWLKILELRKSLQKHF